MSKSTTKNIKIISLILLIIAFFTLEILEMKAVIDLPKVLGVNGIGIRTYGALITAGAVVVAVFVGKEIRKFKELKRIDIADILLFALIFGVIGARLYHLATDWNLYAADPIRALYIWNGGLGIFGAVVGGAFGLWIYSKRKKFKLAYLLDIVAIFMPIAQIAGRAGNLINQEIVGLPANIPWSWYIPGLNGSFHPVFLYEQIGNLLLFIGLFILYKKRPKLIGSLTFIILYIGGYSIVRFIVEFWRIEPRVVFNTFTLNQIVCLFGIILMMIFFIRKFTSYKYKK
jgi:prolipoprotein diacylglyceryl transferase